jgi:serine/threonine protein kinase
MACGDLYHLIHDNTFKIDWLLRVKIAADIANGMAFLHSAKPPIIHRDLKSPNILLATHSADAKVVAKVADFGLSGAMRTVANTEVANPSKYRGYIRTIQRLYCRFYRNFVAADH